MHASTFCTCCGCLLPRLVLGDLGLGRLLPSVGHVSVFAFIRCLTARAHSRELCCADAWAFSCSIFWRRRTTQCSLKTPSSTVLHALLFVVVVPHTFCVARAVLRTFPWRLTSPLRYVTCTHRFACLSAFNCCCVMPLAGC
jgi:hypothetical protein